MFVTRLLTLTFTLVIVTSQRHVIRNTAVVNSYFNRCFLCCSYMPQAVQVRQPNNRGCTFRGQCVQPGDTQTSGCFTYRCERRTFSRFTRNSMEMVSGGCSRDGQCYPVGHDLTTECHTLRCTARGDMFGFEPLTEACSFRGQCVRVNDTHDEGCFRYRCTKTQSAGVSYYSMELLQEACSYKDQCVAVGDVHQDGCFQYRCCRAESGGLTYYSMQMVDGGCDHNGECIPAGTSVEENCCTMRCDVENLYGTYIYTLRPVSVLCRDAYHACHAPGTGFIYVMNGTLTRNCTCDVSGSQVNYTCPPPMMMMMGKGD